MGARGLTGMGEEKIVLDGSSGMLPLATALATAYQQRASDPQIETGKGLGTGARLQALAEGKIQIALASHGLKPEDIQKGNLRVIEVAKGAIVFAVNAGVPITNMTEAQVCDIYPSCYLLEIHELLRSNEGEISITLGEEEAHGRQNYRDVLSV